MAYSRDMADLDYHGLSWPVMDCHGLSWTIIDCLGLSWTVQTIMRTNLLREALKKTVKRVKLLSLLGLPTLPN